MTRTPAPAPGRGSRQVYVSVVGGNEVDHTTLALAEEVGARLARVGAIVVTGGRAGVAEAASKGATKAGGLAVGLLPEADRSQANPWLGVAIATGLGDTRNALVAMNGDAVIALDGAYGTLSEIAHARIRGTTVVAVGSWHLVQGDEPDGTLLRAGTAEEAVRLALDAAGAITRTT